MNEIKITPVNFAMQSGILLGVLGVAKLILLTYSFDFVLIGLLYLLAALLYHFVVFHFAKKFKYTALEGDISFFQAWNISILIYFFGSILTGAIEFAFYKFINPSFLAGYIPKTIQAVQQFATQVQDPSTKEILNEIAVNISKEGIPTPINMVMAHIQNTIFSGIFISIIISAILSRKKNKQ